MWAFDLIEVNGEDMRRDPLEMRKSTLDVLLNRSAPGHERDVTTRTTNVG
jgi:ATP-dependent DNA ligase